MDLAAYKSKKVLVTGGAGAIGSTLVHRLAELGAQVTVLDNLSVGREWALPQSIYFIQGDITNPESLDAAFNNHPQLIVHLAAAYGNLQSIQRPEHDLHTNGLGVLRVLQWAERTEGIERFLFASSGCSIYGHGAPMPLHEDLPPAMTFMSPYQITKMLGELYCEYYRVRGLPTVRLRFFSSFGPGEFPGKWRGVVPNFIFWAMNKAPLPITGGGTETRSFTFVGDLIDGILRAGLAEGAEGQAFNLSSGMERTINELAEIVNHATGNPNGAVYTERRRWDRIEKQAVSIDKARRLLGFNPTTTLESGIEQTVRWFRAHWDRIQKEATW